MPTTPNSHPPPKLLKFFRAIVNTHWTGTRAELAELSGVKYHTLTSIMRDSHGSFTTWQMVFDALEIEFSYRFKDSNV